MRHLLPDSCMSTLSPVRAILAALVSSQRIFAVLSTLGIVGVLWGMATTAVAQGSPGVPSKAPSPSAGAATADGLTPSQVHDLLARIDERQRTAVDWKVVVYIEQKRRGQDDLIYEAEVYRRDAESKLVILFRKPKTEAGKGYLRLDKNMFLYDPAVGKWERRTERERILGTDSRRADFDRWKLAEDFDATYLGREKLGRFMAHKIRIAAKTGVDVAYPVAELLIEPTDETVLKRQDFAESGRLMRTTYYPKWEKFFLAEKGSEVWFPREIRTFDEVEVGNRTTIVIRDISADKIDNKVFTKAWLESQSR